LAFVDVWWTVTHRDGSVLWEWSLTYSLANYPDDDDDGSNENWKIVATTAHVDDQRV
jgi:hypothetical protein